MVRSEPTRRRISGQVCLGVFVSLGFVMSGPQGLNELSKMEADEIDLSWLPVQGTAVALWNRATPEASLDASNTEDLLV